MPYTKDEINKRYGRLFVLERAGNDKQGRALYKCICDCGAVCVVRGSLLRNGETRSCGCFARDMTIRRSQTHGGKGTRLFDIWSNMKQRCLNANCHAYANYGGRGIAVCEEWRTDFACFRDWALANGYAHDLTLDRVNNNGDYCPQNCRWATAKEQGNNKRNTVYITIMGEVHSFQDWCATTGINKRTAWWRFKNGWPAECLFIPARPKSR